MKRFLSLPLLLVSLSVTLTGASSVGQGVATPALRVVSAGPQGEVATLAEANEVRVVFSEPMVTLGRIPERVTAPFFKVTPAISGTFRWSGTTILIFTPDAKRPLPYATTYEVMIDTTATAVSGRRLAQPHRFSFTTPTVKLLSTNWYRRDGRAGAQMVILLRFNQPVRTADVFPHIAARLVDHEREWVAPALPREGLARLNALDPTAVARFDAKVAAVRAVVGSQAAVGLRPTTDWDRKAFPPATDLVAFETTTDVPPDAWVRVTVAPTVPSPAGPATPKTPGEYTIQVEPTFFVGDFYCDSQCPADRANPLRLRSETRTSALAAAMKVVDVTNPQQPVPAARVSGGSPKQEYSRDEGRFFTLEDVGYQRQPPARTYEVTIDSSIRSVDGQTLGYTWTGVVENWHERALTSFGDGHGVWERSGGNLLPFYARNFQTLTQWIHPVSPRDLMPTILKLESRQNVSGEYMPPFSIAPPSEGAHRRLNVTPDRIQSHGLDLSSVLTNGTGLVWAAVKEGQTIPRSRTFSRYDVTDIRASLVQVTNLGITVKDSPQNTLVFVTRLDDGAPVEHARVSIITADNRSVWSGITDARGVALAPQTPRLRDPDEVWKLAFIVTAEKDGDVAYVASDWNEGISAWEFGAGFDLRQAEPMLRGTVFSDRGVYRLGEEIHFKAILRHNTAHGIRLLPPGTRVAVSVRDSRNRAVDERVVTISDWSSAEWTMTLPEQGTLGHYSVRAILESDKPTPRKPEELRPGDQPGPEMDDYVSYEKSVTGTFLVAAYRRPDFRVDVTLGHGASVMAGDKINGMVNAKYLFGGPLSSRPATWSWTRTRTHSAPQAVRDALPDGERWVFVGWMHDQQDEAPVQSREATMSTSGGLTLELPTKLDAGVPYQYTLEADVEDVSRQHIANRASILVHPAPWYIGVRRPGQFIDQKAGFKSELVAISPSGQVVSGVPIEIRLTQVQWNSVRRAVGNGFYEWDTERKEIPVGSWTVTSADEPVALQIDPSGGGYFELEARARDNSGRFAVTRTSVYVAGNGYTAWRRYDHNRIDLVADKPRYSPGETARIMIQSPWEEATALVTTEREGIRSHRQFALRSTQESVSIPITQQDIPNLYVSVLLVKGRTGSPAADPAAAPKGGPHYIDDPSDPGKPMFRLGYVELQVEDRSKRLNVSVNANRPEYRPATDAQVHLQVLDHEGRPSRSEVTLWAVDHGVLSLTAYRTPDVLGSVYVPKALQVMNSDSRQRIVSRRVLTPKGESEGGGGGIDAGGIRKDFRVLAFWVGSAVTDATGRATIDVKLPESLTTYRIMAVAADRASRFGSGESDVRVNKPLTMKPAFPRFLAVGDKAFFGAVVTSQLQASGGGTISIRSLDPDVLGFTGTAEQAITVPAGGSIEWRSEAAAKAIGRARVRMTVQIGNESDAFEDTIPVEVLASPETVAVYGQLGGETREGSETLSLPDGVVHGLGGLHVEMSSTAMVGLGEGARYLVEYPYGCAEQRGSRALALLLAADLGDAFTLEGVDTSKIRPAVQQTLKELERYQCSDGGFAYWAGACETRSPYLTSYLLHVFKSAAELKYDVDRGVRQRAYDYLERQLALPPPVNESWWPAYTAWQAFAVKVLTEGGRNQDSHVNRLYGYRDRMPVFALAHLHDALLTNGRGGTQVDDLRRRMMNAILPEAGSAHVEELGDPYLLWFWNSNVRSTAIVLTSLVGAAEDPERIRPMVRWMMSVRRNGRWGNTQENAHALQALVAYYRKYETVIPDFTAAVMLDREVLARERFRGRSAESTVKQVPLADVLASGAPGGRRSLTFARDGAGTLFYTARLRYAVDELYQQGLDNGFRIERQYEPYSGNGSRPAATTFKAGDLVRVTLTLHLTKERRFVAVTDPLPAGFEPLESWFATTARSLRTTAAEADEARHSWESWWQRGGFEHVERHDDRVQLFATRLSEGRHEFSYIVRATTAGTFRTAPARAEEMYEPEVFGRTATAVITVQR